MEEDRVKDGDLEVEEDRVKDESPGSGDQAGSKEERPRRGLDGFYENFRGVPLKYIDGFIVFCIVALVAVIAHGILRARGIL